MSQTDLVATPLSLRELIRKSIADFEKPISFSDLKKQLKAAGVPTGKKKISDEEIKHDLEIEIRERHVFEHEGKKFGSRPPLTAEEQIEKLMREKIAGFGEKLVTESQLGKPTAKAGEEKQRAFEKVLAKLLDEKVIYAHGTKFGLRPPPNVEEEIEKFIRQKVAGLGEELLTESQLGKPKNQAGEEKQRAFEKVLAKLLDEKAIYAHGKKFSTIPVKPPLWHEVDPHKKPFTSLLNAARKLLTLPNVNSGMLLAALAEKLNATPTKASKPPEPLKPVQPSKPAEPSQAPKVIDRRAVIKEAYEYLCDFIEFQDRLVEIPRLYTETLKRAPAMALQEFHRELEAMRSEWVVELHVLNEVKDAKNPHVAIERDGRLYYFIRWK